MMNTDGTKISNAMSPGIISVLKNTTYILSGQGVQLGVRFVYAIILARFMGPHDYGLIAYGTSLYLAVMPLSKLGVEHVAIRVIGCDRERGKILLQSAQPLRKMITYVVAGIFAVSAFLWESDPQTSAILAVFSLALVGRSFAGWNTALFTAFEANQYSFRMQSIFRPAEVALGLCALALWQNPMSVVLAHTTSWWLEVIFGTILLRKNFPIPKDIWNIQEFRTILQEAIPIGLAAFMSFLVTQGPLILFKNYNGNGIATGNLALAMQIFGILSALPIAAVSASFPLLSRVVARGDGKENDFMETMLRFIFFVGTLLALIGMTIGTELITFVFGQNYADTGDLIGLSLWLIIPCSAANALGRMHMAREKARISLIALTAGALCFIFTAQPAIKALGSHGAILAALFSMTFVSWTLLISAHLERKINLSLAVGRPLCALVLTIFLFHMFPQTDNFLKVTILLVFFIFLWVYFKCISSEEIFKILKFNKKS
jgi:O-antigen/teichoic acid export membrane protein